MTSTHTPSVTVTRAEAPAAGAECSPASARLLYREGLVVPTSGWAAGYTQANLVVLPREWAFDMLLFGQRNPQPVPLLDVTDPGSVRTSLAPGADLRTDLPRYRVWRDGVLVDEPTDVVNHWRDDLVTFGLASGDTVVAIDGKHVTAVEQVAPYLKKSGSRITLVVARLQRFGTIELVEH